MVGGSTPKSERRARRRSWRVRGRGDTEVLSLLNL